jgi:uncharacterized protein (TIGR00369 family)
MSQSKHDAPQQMPGGADLGGFHEVLGYRQAEWVEGRAVIEVDVQPHHINLAGVIHGGVLCSLLDVVMAQAGTYCPFPGRIRKAVTLSMTTTFTGQAGRETIRAVGVRRAGGSRIFNSSGEIFSADGRLLAMGEGTFRLRSGGEKPEGEPLELPQR